MGCETFWIFAPFSHFRRRMFKVAACHDCHDFMIVAWWCFWTSGSCSGYFLLSVIIAVERHASRLLCFLGGRNDCDTTGRTWGALILGVALRACCLIKFPVTDAEMSHPVVYMLESRLSALILFQPDFTCSSLLSFIKILIIHVGHFSLIWEPSFAGCLFLQVTMQRWLFSAWAQNR